MEPWNVKTEDERTEDGLSTFIIYCEDQNSEPLYFRSLESAKVKINAIPNQRSGRLNLINAFTDSMNEGRAVFDSQKYKIIEELRDFIWCVYDRDMESDSVDELLDLDNVSFDLAIQTAQEVGLHVAWSNDAFELWILLHFEDVHPDRIIHRDEIYKRLTRVFKELGSAGSDLKHITDHQYFNYKYAFKKKNLFLNHVLPALKGKQSLALERAQKLQEHFESLDGVEFHRRNPCTNIHRLVYRILEAEKA